MCQVELFRTLVLDARPRRAVNLYLLDLEECRYGICCSCHGERPPTIPERRHAVRWHSSSGATTCSPHYATSPIPSVGASDSTWCRWWKQPRVRRRVRLAVSAIRHSCSSAEHDRVWRRPEASCGGWITGSTRVSSPW